METLNNDIVGIIYELCSDEPGFLLYLKQEDYENILERNQTDWYENDEKFANESEEFLWEFREYIVWDFITMYKNTASENFIYKFGLNLSFYSFNYRFFYYSGIIR